MSLFGPIKQVAYVVPDIEVAIQDWHRQMGVGPFALVREAKPLEGSVYRGQVSHGVSINLAFAYLGDVQLELIEQTNNVPSIYQEAGKHSLHHYGFCVEDFDAAHQQAMDSGYQLILDAGAKEFARMSYVESPDIAGLICELIEWNENTRPYFDGVQAFLNAADSSELIHAFQL